MTKIGKVLFATACSACFSLSVMSSDGDSQPTPVGSLDGLHADPTMISDLQAMREDPDNFLGASEEQVVAAAEN